MTFLSSPRDLRRIATLSAVLLILVALVSIQALIMSQFADARALRDQAARSIATRTHLAQPVGAAETTGRQPYRQRQAS